MKFIVKTSFPEKEEPKVYFWLEVRDNILSLRCNQDKSSDNGYTILSISSDGLYRHKGVGDNLGFPVNDNGIILEEK